ncbi:MAG: acyl-CoA dehydrogenase [Nitrospirae bacterium]|nr:acyl-CoA dehydrogenase [Nitrospirota bacterium]
MDFKDTPEEAKFRAEIREWLRKNAPKGKRPGGAWTGSLIGEDSLKFHKDWQKKLYEGGWAAVAWPKEYGGRGASLMEQVIFYEEMARACAPSVVNVIGIALVGPVLIGHGTEEQKQRFLKPILSGDMIWSQGFSEPNAGSDLASLSTRAVLEGDHFVVNGQKVWTSFGTIADWILLLVRTDPSAPKHRGISCLLVDLHSPGVTIRPLVQMTGDAEFSEVFFDNVRVPQQNLVGALNDGWSIAIATLMHERGGVAVAIQVQIEQVLSSLFDLARRTGKNGRSAMEDPRIRQELARCYAEVQIARWNGYRSLTKIVKDGMPGPEGSFGKVFWTELNQRMQELALNLSGVFGLVPSGDPLTVDSGRWVYGYLRSRGNTIEGGTSEIQRNIVAERVLGLPKG